MSEKIYPGQAGCKTKADELSAAAATLFRPSDIFPSYAAHNRPDGENGSGHEQRRSERTVDRHTFVVCALDEISKQPDDVVADCRNREAFDGRLQSQLQSRALIHRTQQIAVLLLDLHIDSGA